MTPTPDDLSQSFTEVLGPAWTDELPDFIPAPEPVAAEPKSPPPPLRIVEALLFVGGLPLTVARAMKIIRGLSEAQFGDAIDELNRCYRRQNRPYTILPQGEGHVLALRPKFLPLHEKLLGGVREARLSTAAVDVLALVAYRQPTTKNEIDSLRGAESGPILKQLVRRGLVHVTDRGDTHQKDVMYGTTSRFLDMFGLQSLDDLPKTQDLGDL
ncbi:MAG: SMC-Scp complex subunit ScpB [Planctomycetota bacterium]